MDSELDEATKTLPVVDDSERRRFADSLGLTRAQLRILLQSCEASECMTAIELLRAKKHKSPFRARMSAQIRAWLADPKKDGTVRLRIDKPLSSAQFEACKPKWPVRITIPADDELGVSEFELD